MKIIPRETMFIKTMFIAVIMSGTLHTAAMAEDVIRVGGAGSGLGVIKILGEAFEKNHPGIRIRVQPNLGSSGGIKALLSGALDVAVSGRALNSGEQKNGAVAVEFARTPFIFVANKGVSKVDVTTRELEMIYKGQMLSWQDGKRIRLILRPAGDTDTSIVKNISKDMERAVKTAQDRPYMIMAVTDQEAVELVAKTPGALGGTTLVQIETEKDPVKVLSFNGSKPTLDALAKGSYPLAKPLYLVTAPKPPAAALQFIQFVRSPAVRNILAGNGAQPFAGDKRIK